MFRINLSLLLFILIAKTSFGQKNQSFDVDKLGLVWQLKDNQYKGQPKSLAEFVITNKSAEVFPSSNWRIYFQA